MKKDFILDFETIGQIPYFAPAICCSYYIFDWDRFLNQPYTFTELLTVIRKSKLSIKNQIENYDFSYTQDDLQWWLDQPKDIKIQLKPRDSDLTAGQFVDELCSYIKSHDGINHWWSRSNGFDPVILDRLARETKRVPMLNSCLPHWNVRDTRTYIDAKFNFTTKNGFIPVNDEQWWNDNFKLHDSTHDVAADILRLQAIYRAENDLEQTQ